MAPLLIGLITFGATYGGLLFGMWISRQLPSRHLGSDTRDAISVAMAIVGTLAALVLGLLITQANASFAARADAVNELSVNILRLDRVLQRYGPDAFKARATLRGYAALKANELSGAPARIKPGETLVFLETLAEEVDGLRPADDVNQDLKARSQRIVNAIIDERWIIVERMSTPVPTPFLILLVFWLTLLFASFGLFAPRNATTIVVLLFCALAISGGIYMILELGNPTRGLVRTPLVSFEAAIAQLRVAP